MQLAQGLNAKFRSAASSEELGDRALDAIERNHAVCADDIAPVMTGRPEREGWKEIGGQLEPLVRIASHRACDMQRDFAI
jgi:hypothetical protein